MSAPLWLNGALLREEAAHLSPFDRGFALGDGVFETIRARGPVALWLNDHLARLAAGASLLGIPLPLPESAIADGLARLLEAGGHGESALRLTLSRGPSEKRGLWPASEPPRPTLLATVAPLPPPRPPLALILSESTRRNERSPLARCKSLNYGDNLLARREAAARSADDALMLNGADRIACATVGNVFLRLDGAWHTPPVADGVLPGLARARLLRLLPAKETPIARADLIRADAGFLSNSLGLAPIRAIEGRALAEAVLPPRTATLYES
jgi:branched-subunit amino acid aminotransferase/4-amino-4-deoxychorismate lyase